MITQSDFASGVFPFGLRFQSIAILLVASAPAFAQQLSTSAKAAGTTPTIASFQIPSALRQQFLALGTRLQKPGAERVQLSGTLQDSSGSTPVQITLETGDKARVDRGGSNGSIGFDGKNISATSNRPDDSKLIESLVDDLPEALMESVAKGNPIRPIGIGFVDLQGNHCNYIEAPLLSKTKAQAPIRRRYCFDTQTGLLHYVQYMEPSGSSSIAVQVDFSDWHTISGQSVPGSIVRTENKARVFALTFQTLAVGPTSNDNLFKQ